MAITPPNLLLITTDQQRFDAASGAGPGFLRTPHCDDLRRQGITFTRCYSTSPLCGPARATIMTGQHALRHGRYGNMNSSNHLHRERTLPGLLRNFGYQTAAIGKMHWEPQRARHGFEEMILPDDYYRQMQRSGQPIQPMRTGLGQNELQPGLATVPEAMTLTAWTVDQAVDYIKFRRDPTMPFFIWLSFSKPHPPFDPPEPYFSMYRDAPIPEPIIGEWVDSEACPAVVRDQRWHGCVDDMDPHTLRAARAAYYGLITQIDYNIGRVFAALLDEKLYDNTMIAYTSDHGEYLGDHRMRGKSLFHEPSAHVPMVLRLPRSWERHHHGVSCDTPVGLEDLLPTFLAAAGGEQPRDLDGENLVDLLERNGNQPRYIVGNVGKLERPQQIAITDGRWKYLYFPPGGDEQLFDLANDPHEVRDLVRESAHADEKRRLRDALRDYHAQRDSPALVDGDLPRYNPPSRSEAEARAAAWPGYHTEYTPHDIRH